MFQVGATMFHVLCSKFQVKKLEKTKKKRDSEVFEHGTWNIEHFL